MEIYGLKLTIEKKRLELNRLLSNKRLTDANVVYCSEELDKLIVQYQKLISPFKITA